MATATISTTTKARKPKTKPAETCRLSLTICGAMYNLRPLACDPEMGSRAWRLRKDATTTYEVISGPYGASCSCGDFLWRHDGRDATGCKHIRSLRALGLI